MRIVLQVVEGPGVGMEIPILGLGKFLAGRSENADIRLLVEDPAISREHFQLDVSPSRCRLTVRKATNRTYVNSEVVRACDLKDGDTLRVGRTTFHVRIQSSPAGQRRPASITVNNPSENVGAAADSAPLPTVLHGAGAHLPAAFSGPAPAVARSCQVCDNSGQDVMGIVTRLAGQGPSVPDWPLCDACWRGYRDSPQLVPEYWAIRELGRGGMGAVYQALDTSTGSVVAAKTLHAEGTPSPRDALRFRREASVLSQLDHPNIVKFYGLMQVEHSLMIAMEFIPGKTAEEWVEANGPFSIDQGVRLACEILKALEHAHCRPRPVIHRDIKPSNVILASNGRTSYFVKVADFGLARIYDETPWSMYTPENAAGGTPLFMPPEQTDDFRNAAAAADLYSTAATLYYLITGDFTHDLPKGPIADHLHTLKKTAHVPIRERRRDVPARLAGIIDKALRKAPTARYPSAKSFRRTLREFLRTLR